MSYYRQTLRPAQRIVLPATEAPADLETAYRDIRNSLESGEFTCGGWKLGGSNHATQAAFSVSEPYFGALDTSEILSAPTAAPGVPLCEMKGEVEIALRIAPGGQGYDAWAVALEMPASAIENLPEAGVAVLVADRCGAGALLLGPVHAGALPDLSAARLALVVNGTPLSEAGIEALTDTPEALLATFVEMAKGLGFDPEPGEWVATGGITACCPFAPGDRVSVTLDGVAALDFTATES